MITPNLVARYFQPAKGLNGPKVTIYSGWTFQTVHIVEYRKPYHRNRFFSSFLCLRETYKALQLSVFFSFFSFFCQPWPGLQNYKSVFLISQYGGSRQWVQLFLRYPCKNWNKNWYLHFHKTYDHQIWQAGTSRGVGSSRTQVLVASSRWLAGVGDVITSSSPDKLKTSPLPGCLWPPNLAGW